MERKIPLIEAYFSERDVRCILSTPLSSLPLKDEWTWAFTKDASYSVKTTYMLGKGGNLDNFHQAWVDIWSMEVSPKVRHFLWRLCTNTLPVRELLKYRHLSDDDLCPRGCGEIESQSHAIFGCPLLRDFWCESGCESFRSLAVAGPMSEALVNMHELDMGVRIKGAFLSWVLWSDRNLLVFQNKVTPPVILLERVNRLVEENGAYTKKIYPLWAPLANASPRIWLAPPPGIIKLNVDASLIVEGWVGLSAVARDSGGSVLFSAIRRVRSYWSAEIAEAKAIEMAIRLGKRYALQAVIVESDCQVVINRLSKNAIYLADLDIILYNILSSCVCFTSIIWSHVKRDGNAVAHHLAKLTPFGVEQIWENHYPPEVAPYILMDNLSLD
ncbi:uncharacterized protein LOC125495272 [Beta vulgaris subsp. vulgaris]|uniref:uncharacterized protein LOC125495272 n=1 Tax=Beta vulgaris subsp. vulgaris TaxID=3555 RepID=UPI0020374207|nr:uncharacterized protein LOC125495272 [Beta vulgaris subsp. vulgaris]